MMFRLKCITIVIVVGVYLQLPVRIEELMCPAVPVSFSLPLFSQEEQEIQLIY